MQFRDVGSLLIFKSHVGLCLKVADKIQATTVDVKERSCYCTKIKVFYVLTKTYGIEDSLDSTLCKLIEKENNKIFV